jgi:hypothetical protein
VKNSFIVRFLVSKWLVLIGVTGFWAGPLAWVAAYFLGDLADRGLVKLDLKIDDLKEAMRSEKWKKDAVEYYHTAGARLYTEEEKNEIRKKYSDALADYVGFGDGLSDNKNS